MSATLCLNPYIQGSAAYDCGQCLPCRTKRRRLWSHRLMLEALDHPASAFVTLTYSAENLPEGGSLVPLDLQLFLKRFRETISPQRVRFYAVGEYGDESDRPHYHIALYGYGPCRFGRSRYSKLYSDCCDICDTIRDTWGLGHIYVGELEIKSAMYVAGYMLKKMTNSDDPRLNGRHPEFARMSLRPGIGAWAMDEVAHSLLTYKLDEKLVDVPTSLRHGNKLMPLGRYLRRRLRERIGRDAGCPAEVLEEMAKEMLPLSKVTEAYSRTFGVGKVFQTVDRKALLDAGKQRVLQMLAKQKLLKGSKSL